MPNLTRRQFWASAPVPFFAQSRKSSRPNIIIFYVDELRATALRLYRPDGLDTPNLARLASRGVLFDYAFTPHPLCVPARVSLWTGQYSHTHGSRCNVTYDGGGAFSARLPNAGPPPFMHDDRQSMAASFHAAGYRTGIFGKNHCFTTAQLQRWFDVDYSYPANDPAVDGGLNKGLSPEAMAQVRQKRAWLAEQAGRPAIAPFPKEVFETYLANQRGMEFIDRESGGPFLAWISILAPHGPLQAPREYANVTPPDRVKLPPFREGEMKSKNTRTQIYDYVSRGASMSEAYLRQFISVYNAMTAFVDDELGRLLDLLERKNLVDNTIILFTADHGDFAGEHHLTYKTGSLVDSMVRVPLIASWPGHIPAGRREDALVSQVDIMPTLLDLCGLEVPRGVEGQRLPFRPGDKRRQFVYSEYGAGEAEYTWEDARAGRSRRVGHPADQPDLRNWQQLTRERAGHIQMVRTATHKFIRDSNGDIEFYDLKKDPDELDNAHGRPEYRSTEQELDKNLRSMDHVATAVNPFGAGKNTLH